MPTTDRSKELFAQAQRVIPGGVNSPVRAFKAVGGDPLFIRSAKGPYVYDEDDNEYIELINSWGPMILGHATELVQQAIREALPDSFSFGAPTPSGKLLLPNKLYRWFRPSKKVRMVNSGTEAAMSAARLARGYTGRDKIVKFEGLLPRARRFVSHCRGQRGHDRRGA